MRPIDRLRPLTGQEEVLATFDVVEALHRLGRTLAPETLAPEAGG